ncbi:peptide ABC transporter permease [Salipaludibacillus neizhouensis]|uniref:Peptide ABC transporter permease n=1 Tax=Salipaludibacillus neizhouensis TaxID=885475 RepID=A0A3A9K614_9BACI|nr:oligopeptide ABC transporter permease [Salipaludibacillus neizhouensis]RKL66848.1 peptide ABC transporter permease [Salipaludibacillus neizhouensis]
MQHNRPKITKDLFVHEPMKKRSAEEIEGPPSSFWKEARVRLFKNKGAVLGLIIIIIISIMAIVGPMMNNFHYDDQDLLRSNLPPLVPGMEWLGLNGENSHGTNIYEENSITDNNAWIGTDEFGRDLWTRLWSGTQISLFIALTAAFLDLVIGVLYGGISAFYGGKIDDIMQRIVEVLIGIPNLILIILFILILEPGVTSIILAMVITGWVNMSRIVRGQVLQLKGQEFILASKALGASNSQLIWKHLIPNVMGPIIVTLMFTIPTAIFFEAFLSFIGLGIQPPLASLGTLIENGYQEMRYFSYKLIFPAIVISAIMISFNVLGDGLRDALDPKMRK